jgi:translin
MLPNLETEVEEIKKNLKGVEDRREMLIKGTRDIVIHCSKSIVSLHNGEIQNADQFIKKADESLRNLRDVAQEDLQKYLSIAEQELVEAKIFSCIIQNQILLNLQELKVSDASYIMGLLDCVGEVKRLIYDKIRLGNSDDIPRLFDIIESIFGSIYPLSVYDNLVPGLRKKLDVARILIEDIRAFIAEEKGRSDLIHRFDEFEAKTSSKSYNPSV